MTEPATSSSASSGPSPQPAQMVDVDKLNTEDAVAALIDHAVTLGSSDLFFLANEDYTSIQVRHLGIVRPISIVGPERGTRYIQHLKANADMDVGEHRRPGEGRWIFSDDEGGGVDLRISTIPTLYGEDLAIRLLSREHGLFSLDQLGMHKPQLGQFRKLLSRPSGLILCTGPSGSGKTATLYAALRHLHDGSRKINTIEDPVEFAVDGIRQSQANSHIAGAGFADLLRGVLRQSPDIIMIGEIRDPETAITAVRAANSGHLVFSTLHAPVAIGAIQSMRSLGVPDHFLATSLRGIIAQRLVRTFCEHCQQAFDLSSAPEVFEEISHLLGDGQGHSIGAAKGCERCGKTGYASRTGVFEVLEVDRDLRNMLSHGTPAEQLRHKAVESGMLEFRQAALLQVARRRTSIEEVFRVVPSEYLLTDQ